MLSAVSELVPSFLRHYKSEEIALNQIKQFFLLTVIMVIQYFFFFFKKQWLSINHHYYIFKLKLKFYNSRLIHMTSPLIMHGISILTTIFCECNFHLGDRKIRQLWFSCVECRTFFFFREFQLMMFILDDSSLSSNQDTNKFLVYVVGIEP